MNARDGVTERCITNTVQASSSVDFFNKLVLFAIQKIQPNNENEWTRALLSNDGKCLICVG